MVDEPAAPAHRRADLVIEVGDATGLPTGSTVRLTVGPRLHIFDNQGHRIDRITR